jgi:hypothetical protein
VGTRADDICIHGEQKANPGAGARHGPNVCRFVSSGWPRHESEANLYGLDLGTFGERLALVGCRVARLAGIEDWGARLRRRSGELKAFEFDVRKPGHYRLRASEPKWGGVRTEGDGQGGSGKEYC